MAGRVMNKVAQRIVASHRPSLTQRSHFTTSGSQHLVNDQISTQTGEFNSSGLLTPGYIIPTISGQSLWMKANSENMFDRSYTMPSLGEIGNENDIPNELSLQSKETNYSEVRSPKKIDTHALVKKLMEGGFSLNQAESLTMMIVGIVDDNTDAMRSSMVTKSDAELTIQKVSSQLAILRRDMMIMEKTDFTELMTKIERITHELQQLQRVTKDDISKISSDMTLDFNLEKGKVKDMHHDHLKIVEHKHAVIFEKLNSIDKELQNLRSYINTENAALQTVFERYKSDTIKLAFGAVATCMTIVLGFYRLWT